MWIKRLLIDINANWKVLMLPLLGATKEKLLITQQFKDIRHTMKTKFHIDLLGSSYNFIKIDIKSISNLLDEPLFDNLRLNIDNNLLVNIQFGKKLVL